MKRTLWTIGGMLVLLIAAVLIVPSLIDWNHYKGDIQAQARNATGRDLAIKGDIKITVLPAPALIASDVELANIAGASAPHMARLNHLEVRVALAPLLTGRVEVKRIKLVDPVIELEVLADGRRNWTFDGTGGEAPPAAAPGVDAPGSAPPVTLDSFTIDNGTLVYRDARNGTVERVDRINAKIAAASLNGPFESTGSLRARGVPVAYEVNVGDIIHGRTVPFSLKLGLEPGKTTLQMSGTAVGLADEPKIKGKVRGEGESLAEIIHAVRPGMTVPGPLAQAFSFEGALAAAAASAEIKSLAFRLGNAQASGDLAVEYIDKLAIAARIAANRIDMDRWLTLPAVAPAPPASADKPDAATDPKAASAPMPAPPPFQLPGDVDGSLIFSAEAITYRNGVVRDAVLNAELADGKVTVSQLSGQLPGGSDLAVFGAVTAAEGQPRFEGKLETTVSDLRGVLRWLGAEIEGVQPDRLRKMTLAARVLAVPTQAQLANIDMRFDSSRLTGGVTVAFTKRPSFGADVSLDRLSLDGYLPKRAGEAAKGAPGPQAQAQAKPADKAAAATAGTPAAANPFQALGLLTTFDANLKARIESLEYHGDRMKNVFFDGTLYNGRLDIRRFSVAQAAGVSGTMSGALTGLESLPEADGVVFQLRAADVPKALKLAGLEPPLPSKKVGTVTVNGRIDGKLLAPRLNVKIEGAGATATVKGQLDGMGLVPAAKGLSFRLKTADAPRLLALGGIDVPKAARNLGQVTVSGSLDGNLLQPNVALSLKAAGGELALQGPVDTLAKGAMIDLALKAGHPDVAGLLKALGTGYRPAGKTGGLALAGRLKGGPERLTLTGLDATLGETSLKGDVTIGLGGRRPDVSADIQAGAIVLDPFLPAQRTAWLPDRPGGPAKIIPAAWPGEPSAPARSPDSGLVLAAVPGRWSRDPIDLSGLAAVDGRLSLKSPSIRYRQYTLENANLSATLKDGKLAADKVTGILFGGALQATLDATASARPRLATVFALENMNVGRATQALTGKAVAGGRMSLRARLETAGASVADMIGGLNGDGALRMKDVDVRDADTGTAMAGALGLVSALNQFAGVLGGAQRGAGLVDLSGTFGIRGGVAQTNDMKVVSNVGDGAAKGFVDLPRWRIDVQGHVKLAQNVLTQLLAAKTRTDVTQAMPFTVRGRLDKPTINLDTSKLPGGALPIPGVDKLIKKAPKGVGTILQGILGGGQPQQGTGTTGSQPPPPGSEPPPPPPPSQTRQQEVRPEDILRQIFRR